MKKQRFIIGAAFFIGCIILGLVYLGKPHTLFSRMDVQKKDIMEIQLRYSADEENFVAVHFANTEEENTPFEKLIQYLDCAIKKVEMPTALYTVDPLTATIVTEEQEVQLHFITTEGKNQTESRLYAVLGDEVYQMENEDAEITKHPINGEKVRDPLYTFFFTYKAFGETGRGARYPVLVEKEGIDSVPAVTTSDYTMQTMDEIIQNSDAIFSAVLQQGTRRTEGSEILYTEEFYKQHQFHLSMPTRAYSDIEIAVKDRYWGETDPQMAVTIPIANWSDQGYLELGITEKRLEKGKEYLFFMKQLDCEDGNPLWVSDFYFGIMEIAEDGKLLPLFNLDSELMGEYYISLEALQERIAAIKK